MEGFIGVGFTLFGMNEKEITFIRK